MRSRIAALPLAIAISLCTLQAHAQETYRLTKIEGLTFFGDLNNKGVVVGATRAANGAEHAAIWKAGQLTDIHDRIDSNAVQSDLRDVNDRLDVVGTFVDPNFRGFLLSGRTLTEIQPLPGDDFLFANGINDRKQVIGGSFDSETGLSKQFVWDRGQYTVLEGLSGQTNSVEPNEIQDAGIVAGSDNLAQRAVIWQSGTVMDIGGLPGSTRNGAAAISDRGEVAGSSTIGEPQPFATQITAFTWKNGVVTPLPTLFTGFSESDVTGINNRGDVVGASFTAFAEDSTATLWQDGAVYDLNQLIDPSDPLKSTVTLIDARAINDAGQIVAGARAPDFSVEFYLLTPVR